MKKIYIQTYNNNNNNNKKKKKLYTPMRVHTRTRLHNNEDTKIY